ncbi:MAG: hypothetical protein IJU14_04690 [Clostridia bacterium]|nr:hypothetical protein [Clostridia bacterium]
MPVLFFMYINLIAIFLTTAKWYYSSSYYTRKRQKNQDSDDRIYGYLILQKNRLAQTRRFKRKLIST